jgi:DNA damage-binding protein 2
MRPVAAERLAFWDYVDVFERTVLDSPAVHLWLISAIRFMGADGEYCYTSSMDGSVARVNCETHSVTRVAELNAGIAPPTGEEGDTEVTRDWRSVYSMDVDSSRRCCLLGDDRGEVHVADARMNALAGSMLAAKRGTKVVSVSVNPADPSAFATAGNDHVVRVWDIRRCGLRGVAGAADPAVPAGNKALALALASLPHPRVVNAAAFSPITGRKLLTTCQDNRVRVWDNVAGLSASHAAPSPPDRELVHSHDFSRYLTAFKAVWDPKDASESAFVIGRYISEDVGGRALHPVDYLSAANGRLLAAMKDANVATICPVAVPHPRREVVATGSSRNIYVWEPEEQDAETEAECVAAGADRARAAIPRMLDLDVGAEKKKRAGKGREDDDDDDGPGFGGGGKKSKAAKAA